MSVEMSQTTIRRIGEPAEDDIVDLVYCTRVIAKSRIDITGAIDEPFVYEQRVALYYARACTSTFENVNS